MIVWVEEGKKYIGLKEIAGKSHNLTIQSWLSNLRAWWSDDETPWCGVFVAHCIKYAGYDLPKNWYRAKDWLNWGHSVIDPVYGCIAVFTRDGGGHVGIVVGKDSLGRIMVLGGNQGNAVSIAPFNPDRVAGYRLPVGYNSTTKLPLMETKLKSSDNEA